jgi:dTDP-4-amino-4,6-dideoxygalactose transaminase
MTGERALHVGRPNLGPREVFDAYVDRIYASNWLTNDGPLVRELESAIAERVGVRHCVAMCNGTVALEIAIRALGLEGEVIVPSFTFVATAHALSWQGIRPVFADVDPVTHTLDPRSVEAAITPRTTGIIGVHLWGRPADVAGLQDVADRHGLALMFDAAHAFGCTAGGRPVGGSGRAEVFSFHATKFFNTFEGGAIVTDDDELAATARLMRNFGFAGYDNVIHPGTNGKMPEISAAMGLTNLPGLDVLVEANRVVHEAYSAALDDVPGVSVLQPDPAERSNHQYVVAMVEAGAEARDGVVAALHAQGVLARKYFWPGVHRMQPYASWDGPQPLLPVTEWVADRVVVLPAGPGVTADDVETVRAVVASTLARGVEPTPASPRGPR